MSRQKESKIEVERRDWVERHERFKDLQEQYERQRAATTDPDVRRRLAEEFAAERRAQREADIALGKRSPSTGVAVRQTMWLQWLEIAVKNEMVARRCFEELIANQASDPPGLRRSRGCVMLPGCAVCRGIAQPTGAAGVDATWQTCWVASSWW